MSGPGAMRVGVDADPERMSPVEWWGFGERIWSTIR
jgi:hypothetical protein